MAKTQQKKVQKKDQKKGKKKSSNVAEYASLSCKRTLVAPSGLNFVTNTMYNLMDIQLADFARASVVASAYQHYRMKKVTVTIRPTYDTFAIGNSKMHLYFMIDKSGSIPTTINLEGLKQMGARPFTLDEKERHITWAPTVLESTMFAPGAGNTAASKYLVSPWLSTANAVVSPGAFVASQIDHLGLYWFNEQLVGVAGTQYSVDLEVQFEFKKARSEVASSSIEALPAKVAQLDNSADGVVGGPDSALGASAAT